ncbi:MAG: hypothetical protein CL916_10795, partial [Deltaproteobacteria bacterium]|nr:hypothetical protein [Deltaproteobacteria bacterium]
FAQQVRVFRHHFHQELCASWEKNGKPNIRKIHVLISKEDWSHDPVLYLYILVYKNFHHMYKQEMEQEALFFSFSDMCAQTIAYTLLTVRWLFRATKTTLTRNDIELLPQTSGVVSTILSHMMSLRFGAAIDSCIEKMCIMLSNIDLNGVFLNSKEDPILHFYEDFLEVYQKGERKDKGVYYTPDSVVHCMVQSIDDQLKDHFQLPLGLASTKTWNDVLSFFNAQGASSIHLPNKVQSSDFFIRILDPATGTGNFLTKVIETVRCNIKRYWTDLGWSKEQKIAEWNAYVRGEKGISQDYSGQGLLHRLFAFEVMEAPYLIAHIRLAILLYEDPDLPFLFTPEDCTNIFLINALEHPKERESNRVQSDLEQKIANVQTTIAMTVVLGNPPYLGGVSNRTDWITQQIEMYKYIHGVHFEEKKHWLNDDYVRFFRLGQLYIEYAQLGVLCYITPHSFLDNPTFRGMRKSLLHSFDDIFIVNLYGNARKVVILPNGERDENIFDIMQGVSISLCRKTTLTDRKELGRVYTHDVYGSRESKLNFLHTCRTQNISWTLVSMNVYHQGFDYYFFVPKDFRAMAQYSKGFSLRDLFLVSASGIVTARDAVVIDTDKDALQRRMQYFFDPRNKDDEVRQTLFPNKKAQKYPAGDTRGWKLSVQRQKKPSEPYHKLIQKIAYRPFDIRFLFYTPQMVDWGREDVMSHLIQEKNIGLVFKRGGIEDMTPPVFITKTLIDFRSWSRPGMQGGDSVGPLYVYDDGVAISNLNPHVMSQFKDMDERCSNEDIIDYIYALTHSKKYMRLFSEFLSFDYPRIPYPSNREEFWKFVEKGQSLRAVHLLESDVCMQLSSMLRNKDGSVAHQSQLITQCRPKGATLIKAKNQKDWNGQIWINDSQYFADIPQYVWNMYIGGYQPARKWIKSRRMTASKPGYILNEDEVIQYSRLVAVLKETHRLMTDIDTNI